MGSTRGCCVVWLMESYVTIAWILLLLRCSGTPRGFSTGEQIGVVTYGRLWSVWCWRQKRKIDERRAIWARPLICVGPHALLRDRHARRALSDAEGEASIRNIISHHYHRRWKETNTDAWLKSPDSHRTLEQLPYLLTYLLVEMAGRMV